MPMLPIVLALPALLASQAPAPRDSLVGPGVSHALATWRAARISHVRYALTLDVTAPDTARGHVTVRFTRRGGGDAILDFRGFGVSGARANGRAVAGLVADGAHVRVPAASLKAGENVIDLDFTAAIAAAGASIIRVRDAADGADYLYTLLVPADANALFPCFDQPDLKARVTLALRTRRGWTAVANGAARDSVDDAGGRTFRFAETQPISTYLVAFAAGPWATRTRTVAGRPMTLYMRQSRAAEVEADSLFDANGRALAWLERWFDRPYPFGKYDFVLAPAFPFGGMEHPGAVFYNEEQFVFREPPTLPQRLGRTATVYHEVAHQWFGDLVTMRWFDDLWLKEGFSTYMAARMQDALDPSSMAWKTFHLRNKPPAYAVDVTDGTVPVWQRLANLDQAKSNYGPIVYNKAPSILKQLEFLVGERAFQAGLRSFLARHAFGNATWRDLLAAVGQASGRDLGAWGEAYILRPGLPVIEATPLRDATGRIVSVRIAQQPARALSGATPWPVRTTLLVRGAAGDSVRIPVTLAAGSTDVRLPRPIAGPALVYPNAGDHAYAVVLLDSASVGWTERHIASVDDGLLRAMLWGSLWDLVRDARLDPSRYLALAMRELPGERDEQIAATLLARVGRTVARYLSPAQRAAALPALETLLVAGASDRARGYGIRKAHLDALVAVAGTPATLARLDAALDDSTITGLPLRPPTRWAIVTALVQQRAPSAEARLAAEARRDSTTEGRRRAFVAAAARPDSAAKAALFDRWFADRALNEDWVTASLPAFVAPEHERATLSLVRPALDSLPWLQRNRRIFFLGAWLDAFVAARTDADAMQVVETFLREHPALPADLRAKLLQAADELRRTVAIRARWAT